MVEAGLCTLRRPQAASDRDGQDPAIKKGHWKWPRFGQEINLNHIMRLGALWWWSVMRSLCLTT